MKILLLKLYAAALVITPAVAVIVHAAELYVMSSGSFAAAYKVLGPRFIVQTDDSLGTTLGPSMGKSPEVIPNRLTRGEPVDVIIMVDYALDDPVKQGKVIPEPRVKLTNSRTDMVIREGATKPDIGSPEAPKHMLLHAESIAYSGSMSGVYTEHEPFEELGVGEQVKTETKMTPRIPVASVVATGDYEASFQ